MSEGLKFHISARGDRTTGSGDHCATVEIPFAPEDLDYREFVRDALRAAFATIFDVRNVRVLTESENETEDLR